MKAILIYQTNQETEASVNFNIENYGGNTLSINREVPNKLEKNDSFFTYQCVECLNPKFWFYVGAKADKLNITYLEVENKFELLEPIKSAINFALNIDPFWRAKSNDSPERKQAIELMQDKLFEAQRIISSKF